MDGKIYIYLTDKKIDGGQPNSEPEKPEKEKTISPTIQFLQHEMFHFAKQQATQMFNYTIENIGNFTGNYQQQRDIQATLSAANTLSNIAITGITVGLTINPFAGVIASAVAATSLAINYGRQERLNNFMVKRQNREIEIMRDISGLNSLTNGGRL